MAEKLALDIFSLLGNKNTRLDAAGIILGRKVDPEDISVTQHLIGFASPEERLANLLVEAAKEKGLKIV